MDRCRTAHLTALALLSSVVLGSAPQPPVTDPSAAVLAIEAPVIAGEIDAPATIQVGRAELRVNPEAHVFLLSASGRVCGALIDGPATLAYEVQDPLSLPLARRNVPRADGLSIREAGGKWTARALLRGAAIWGWDLNLSPAAPRAAGGKTLPAWLQDVLKDKLEPNPARDLLVSAANGDTGYRWAVFHTSGDDLMLDVDPRPVARIESLLRFRRIPRGTGPLSGRLTTEELVAQPIGRPWWQPVAVDVASLETEIEVRNDAGSHITVSTHTRIGSLRDGVQLLPLALLTERIVGGDGHAYGITKFTADGATVPYVHWRGTVLAALPRPLARGQTTLIEVIADGNVLERPEGDNYWVLGIEPWYPQPSAGGIENAAFRLSVQAAPPFVPLAPGQILEQPSASNGNTVTTLLKGPMRGATVAAGKYTSISDDHDGARVHVSTYAAPRPDEARRVAGIVHSIRGCLEQALGVPYPFQELELIEINDWGWGQAPPGMIFITKEALLSPARAATLDDMSLYIAQQASRGVNERLAHEVAHGWFPHVAQVDRAEESWLSESFADYMSIVCVQRASADARRGRFMFERQLSDWKTMAGQISDGATIYLADHLGQRDQDWRDRRNLLYGKGPLVLHALRHELARLGGSDKEGDRMFFTWMRSYVKNFTFKPGGTHHLVGILNQITNKDWQPWFERYVYGTETPK